MVPPAGPIGLWYGMTPTCQKSQVGVIPYEGCAHSFFFFFFGMTMTKDIRELFP